MLAINRHTQKTERLAELIAWPIVLGILLILTSQNHSNLSATSKLAFGGLVLMGSFIYYYLSYVILPLTKRHFMKNLGDIIFLAILFYLSLRTESYLTLLVLIPLSGSFLILSRFNSVLVAALTIILAAGELFTEYLYDFNIYLNPASLFLILAVILTLYLRLISQKARYENILKQEEQAKLADLNKQLTSLENQGKEFTTLAAQQIFTPLATIQSFIQTLQSEKDGKLTAKQKVFVKETSGYVEKMHRLLKELLYISRLEFSGPLVALKSMDVISTLKTTIEKFEPELREKNLELKLKYPNEEMPEVKASVDYLPEMFERLLDNAIRYSPEKTEINISLQVFHKIDGPHLYTEIKDQGYGIPQEEQKYLFRKFFRGTNILENDNHGNGLSLFIVKLLADRQNALIHYKSTNEGTIFQIDFPIINPLASPAVTTVKQPAKTPKKASLSS